MSRSLRRRPALRFRLLAGLPWLLSAALAAAPLQTGAPLEAASPVLGGAKGSSAVGADEAGLAAFADVSADWGRGVEAAIERAYRECFRTLVVDGRIMTLRLPFAQNSERSELAESDLAVAGGGKAEPRELWAGIETLLSGADFAAYLAALGDGREKLILFDIPGAAWSASLDRFAIERLRSGRYPGLPHKPVVLASGRGATAADVYNYIYCVGRSGIDCSGFVWHALRSVAAAGGLDLDRAVGRDVGLPRGAKPALYVGTWFYDPRSGRTRTLADEPRSLLPGDILLFRGEDGSFIHSVVIQSVDLAAGRIRYLQSTDESPREERGVHESVILFDPARPELSIKDPSVRWLQRRGVAFDGEPPPAFRDDGERYRAYAEAGGGVAVRLKSLEKTAAKLRAAAAAADAADAAKAASAANAAEAGKTPPPPGPSPRP